MDMEGMKKQKAQQFHPVMPVSKHQYESCNWFHIWVRTIHQYGSAGSCHADETAKGAFGQTKEQRKGKARRRRRRR